MCLALLTTPAPPPPPARQLSLVVQQALTVPQDKQNGDQTMHICLKTDAAELKGRANSTQAVHMYFGTRRECLQNVFVFIVNTAC